MVLYTLGCCQRSVAGNSEDVSSRCLLYIMHVCGFKNNRVCCKSHVESHVLRTSTNSNHVPNDVKLRVSNPESCSRESIFTRLYGMSKKPNAFLISNFLFLPLCLLSLSEICAPQFAVSAPRLTVPRHILHRGPGWPFQVRLCPRRNPRGTRRAPARRSCRGRTGGPPRSRGRGRCG